MATRGRPLPGAVVAQLRALHRHGQASIRGLARVYCLDRNTVRKYQRRAGREVSPTPRHGGALA